MSDTKNVKLGVCKVSFDGVDLGYTSGGVDVTVKTDTHKTMVDQFGKTPINEYIMGREVMVKCPLAETTLTNLVAIMPGAVLVQTGGVSATGTMTIVTVPADGLTVLIAGATVTFKTTPVAANDVALGATVTSTATNLAAFVNASADIAIDKLSATSAAGVVTLTNKLQGVAGNSVTIATGTAGVAVTVSGATLTGGVNGVAARVDVPTGIGISLLAIAKVLTLHPVSLPANNLTEDFTIFHAATAGALQYAYKLENERIFSCEFHGYPDSVTGKLFAVGDTTV
jgi:hypothetical protein